MADRTIETHRMSLPLDSMNGLELIGIQEDGVDPVKTRAGIVTYHSRRALQVVNDDGVNVQGMPAGAQSIVIVKASTFKDGTIEADVAAMPRQNAPSTTRGFVGMAFHVQDHGSRYESIYLRMTNGRSTDQLERNHSTQYVMQPDFPWKRLRDEKPGVYESYVDLQAGEWTRIKIVVEGNKARLFVNGATQPCLLVNDLKLAITVGQIALWTGSNTQAYFSKVVVRPALE